ncbi:MAG: 4Fe-4S binding protein [Aliifodinibius sp.]|nr:4Fe-4S binding protein [Fodinibius sp.]
MVKLRSFQFLVILPNLLLFYVFIISGLFGTPVGNHNIMIVFVWILWWVLLIAVMVPFGSRIWCTICPLPSLGEWLQRLTLINVRTGKLKFLRNKLYGLKRDWPKPLQNIWMQNVGFLLLAIFSVLLVTRPIVSVAVLGSMIFLAIGLSLIYRQRAFCMYLCPVSGFLGLYSMASTIELRSIDTDVCKKCKHKNCLRGSELNYGCPWYQYLGDMDRNNYCGLCMECVKNCPHDNIALNLRPFASDTKIKGYDEAWKAFIMLTLALVYSVTLLGPWGLVKNWANVTETGQWGGFLLYAAIIVLTALVVFPAIYGGFVWLSRLLTKTEEVEIREIFLKYAYTLVPLGLLAWIAFSVPLLLVNGSYIAAVISDPFGWGWDLFGTAGTHWNPMVPHWVPFIQIGLLIIGLYYAIGSGLKIGREIYSSDYAAVKSFVPIGVFLTAVTCVFLRLYVG